MLVPSRGDRGTPFTKSGSGIPAPRECPARDKVKALFAVEAMAELHLRLGAPKDAARLLAAARRHRTAMAHPLDADELAAFHEIVEQTRTAAGAVTFAIACAEGGRSPSTRPCLRSWPNSATGLCDVGRVCAVRGGHPEGLTGLDQHQVGP
jgi:hypothetical protein